MRRLTSTITLILLLTLPALTQAEDYLPLSLGNSWHYTVPAGESELLVVTGTTTVWDTEVSVITYTESPTNEGLENYWTTASDGDANLWGWWRPDGPFGVLYEPAIVFADGPLYLGKTWTQTVDYYGLPGPIHGGTIELTLEVLEEGTVVVPAGGFYAYGIGQTALAGPLVAFPDGFAFDGTDLRGADRQQAENWWSDGVGRVQYDSGALWQLASFDLPTPTLHTTWGAVKRLYQ